MDGAGRYYRRLFREAIFGWLSTSSTSAWLLVTAVVLVLGAVTYFGGKAAELSNLSAAIVSGAVLLLVLFVRLAIAPYRLYRQDGAKQEAADKSLAAIRSYQQKADALNEHHESGVELRNAIVFKDKYRAWKEEVDEWKDELEEVVTKLFSKAQADAIIRLDTYPLTQFGNSLHPDHDNKKSMLSERLRRLAHLRDEMLRHVNQG